MANKSLQGVLYSVAIPSDSGQVSTSHEVLFSFESSRTLVAIPSDSGQVSTEGRREKMNRVKVFCRNPF